MEKQIDVLALPRIPMSWLNLTLYMPRDHADAFGDALMEAGAISINVEDAAEGTVDEAQARVLHHRQVRASRGRVAQREAHRAAGGGEAAGGHRHIRGGVVGGSQHGGSGDGDGVPGASLRRPVPGRRLPQRAEIEARGLRAVEPDEALPRLAG